jgi:hypothetical protein
MTQNAISKPHHAVAEAEISDKSVLFLHKNSI